MKIAFDYAGDRTGQRTHTENNAPAILITTRDSETAYQYIIGSHSTGQSGMISIDELDRLSGTLTPDSLLTTGDNLMCSLSQHNRMTQQIALDAKSLDQFSFILSHRLRAPIANALGLAALLESEMVSEDECENCQKLLCAAVHEIDHEIRAMNDVMTQYRKSISGS